MKNLLVFVGLFIAFVAISQENYNNVIFKFDSKSEFTNQFQNKTVEKNYNFIISGLESESQAIKLKKAISSYRGVQSFTISELNANNERNAELKLYKYADHWKYYEYLFSKNGINKIMIGNKEYLPSELEK